MKLKTLLWAAGAAGTALLVYGALVETRKLTLERYRIRLAGWPERLDGFRIAVLGDFHINSAIGMELASDAVLYALGEQPDAIVIPGDFVGYWKPESVDMLAAVLEPLRDADCPVIAVPGNHDYYAGDPSTISTIGNELGIRLLRNENMVAAGVRWVGIDSANMRRARPDEAFHGADPDDPTIVLWHEPDMVDTLQHRADLMISGHSHGGQFLLGGWAPLRTENGSRYLSGFYPDARVPLFVTRGIGTTGPPSRFGCRPEVAVLTLFGYA
jgi:predicted MPP superfamily phosphohydrolase